MLTELKIYFELKEACLVYLSSLKKMDADTNTKMEGMINAYVKVLNDDRISAQNKKMKKDFCEWYLNYYKEEIGD